MKNIFIDSQVWLSLYDFSSDDLDQFGKLDDLIDKDVKIYLTRQVVDEVNRNRENKIKDALSQFNKLSVQIPNLCKGYDEHNTFAKSVRLMKEAHKELLVKVAADIEVGKLHADVVIKNIFSKLSIIERNTDIVNQSVFRYNIGNPPGKDKSYGDAINWLTLLNVVPDGEDLYFICGDKDFRSVLSDNRMNGYLYNEWNVIKKSEVILYKSLTDFFNLHLKHIELKTENYKNALIEQLRDSYSFANTHSVIARLSVFSSWSEDQVIALLKAADTNGQVSSIITDSDISSFYESILRGREEKILQISDLHWIMKKLGYKIPGKQEEEI
jgi:hypothetical protein